MTTVKAAAVAFTSTNAIVLIGKDWVDVNKSRYRLHVYPSQEDGITFAKKRPNVILLTRPDRRSHLAEYAKSIHRVLVFCTPQEAESLGLPIIDADMDEEGKPVGPIRTSVQHLQDVIENKAVDLDITPRAVKIPKKARKQKKAPKRETLPTTLNDFMEAIEHQMEEGDGWKDLEHPLMEYALDDTLQPDFMDTCKKLVNLGVSKQLSRRYYKWVSNSEQGVLLRETLRSILDNDERFFEFVDTEGFVDIEGVAEEVEVEATDLHILVSLYQQMSEDDETE